MRGWIISYLFNAWLHGSCHLVTGPKTRLEGHASGYRQLGANIKDERCMMNNRICYIVAIRSARSKPTGLTCHRDARMAVFAKYGREIKDQQSNRSLLKMYSTVDSRVYIRQTNTTDRYIFGTQQ